MKSYHSVLLLVSLVACTSQQKNTDTPNTRDSVSIVAKIFPLHEGGFGYDILVNDTVIVHQPHIPSFSGSRGFPTVESAQQVADLVITKIRNHEMPPSVSARELSHFNLSE